MSPATARPRLVLVVALVLGVLGMHALTGPAASADASAAVGPDHGTAHQVAPAADTDHAQTAPLAADPVCPACDAPGDGHHGQHSVVSMCLAVLASLALLVLLAAALLRWAAVRAAAPGPRPGRRSPGRGPPPQGVSLLQLCLQRV